MDISKIINDTVYKCVHDVADDKFKTDLKISNEDNALFDAAKQNEMLMHYSNSLLEAYHKELSAALAAQGIKI